MERRQCRRVVVLEADSPEANILLLQRAWQLLCRPSPTMSMFAAMTKARGQLIAAQRLSARVQFLATESEDQRITRLLSGGPIDGAAAAALSWKRRPEMR